MYFFQVSVFYALFILVIARNDDYIGTKIYKVTFKEQKQQDHFGTLKNDIIDFLRNPSFKYNVSGLAMVPPSQEEWFEQKLQEINVEREVFIDDVYRYLAAKETVAQPLRNDGPRNFDFDGYYRYDEILNYLYSLQNVNSTIDLQVVEVNQTEEGRPLVYVRVSSNPSNNNPIVIVEAGMNPREWVTIPSAINVLNKLMESEQAYLTNNLDWIIIPVLNPDGYEYTHTDLRLWTKSKSLRSGLGFICPGVNINRNFDIDWSLSDSSSTACSHLYAGIEPFSEPESLFIKGLIDQFGSLTRLYISIQNNGGFISYPWQYERAASGMFREHLLLGRDMLRAIDNESYRLDAGSLLLADRASGTSSDYAQRNGVLYSLNVDVLQNGDDTVIIPADQIVDRVEDVWRAIAVAAGNFA